MAEAQWDQTVFNETLERYMEVSKRTAEQIVNTKAYYVARKATWFTVKASRAAVADSLGSRVRGTRRLSLRPGTGTDAPLAALIIQARRGAKGLKGLYGQEMTAAIDQMLSTRLRSLAFLRSGWLPAVRTLARVAKTSGAPAMGDARQFGPDQGSAKPAIPGMQVLALIENHAASLSKTSRLSEYAGFKKMGEQGLQRAFDDEAASMEQYIEEHMRPDADAFNRAQR